MLLKIIDAQYVKGYEIELTFSDGVKKTIDLKESLKGPVFEPLKKITAFKKFSVNRWTIEWENGADFAPEYLYELAMKQNQKTSA